MAGWWGYTSGMTEELPDSPNESPTDYVVPHWPSADHCGIVAVIGKANAGKSTLVNRLLGEKVSIVTAIAQTTRNVVRGILTEKRGQLVFLDTPGIHKPITPLGKRMNSVARDAVEGSDAILLVLDGSVPPSPEDEGWFRRLLFADEPVVVAINKRDRSDWNPEPYRALWSTLEADKKQAKAATWLEISAETGDGVDGLMDHLFGLMPPGPLLFPAEVLTDFPRKLAIADIIREKIIPGLLDELPHMVAVGVDKIIEGDEWTIEATVYVAKPTQKGIVIGHKGRRLKTAKYQAEQDLSAIFERKVTLTLWVKAEKNWTQNHFLLKQLGYVE